MEDIFWIGGNPRPGLAIVARPRGGDWLEDEMSHMKSGGIDTLVSLLEKDEADWLGLGSEAVEAARAGIEFVSYPIPDTHVPSRIASFRTFVADLAARLRKGERIGVHCRGSIGRATVTAACMLIHLGWKPGDALNAVEETRGCPVPDTEEQRAWIMAYEAGR